MKHHHKDDPSIFRDRAKNSKMPKPYDHSQLNFKNDFPFATRHQIDLISSPKFQKRTKAKDFIFGASSVRESIGYDAVNDNSKRINSHKILPPLKPALHVSSYTPRKNPQKESSPHLLTITFSCNEIKRNKVFNSN